MAENQNKDVQLRKVQIVQNNPAEHGMTHERIKEEMGKLKSCVYYIMADEVGGKDGTLHTHVYAVFKNPVRFSTLKNRFPSAHIERAVSTHAANIDYVRKEGKWKNTDKSATSLPNTVEEWGECPPEAQGSDPHFDELYSYIKEGLSNYEILERDPSFLRHLNDIDRVRLAIQQEEYRATWRSLSVTYIYGRTGAGKSRYVMEMYGYEKVFRVTDYVHPWDTYMGQDVVVFEEFSSSFPVQKFLNYADGYPLKLEARYTDKQACFTKLYIISNIPLEKQYPNVKDEQPQIWDAFLRRIHRVMWFKDEKTVITYEDTKEYFERDRRTGLPLPKLDF